MRAYEPRPITTREPIQRLGWDLKQYAITFGGATFDASRFDDGIALAMRELPLPATAAERLGVGFLIAHQGRDVDYLVLGWWDRENELPLRIFVREQSADLPWRAAKGSESVCVWDLQVIWAERNAYVETVLENVPADAGRKNYLARDAGTAIGGAAITDRSSPARR